MINPLLSFPTAPQEAVESGDHEKLPKVRATAVILAAGQGTRMKSGHPKAMQRLLNRPMIAQLLETARKVFEDIVVVVGPDMAELETEVAPAAIVRQHQRLGTGHAARMAEELFGDRDVVVLYADNPLVTEATMRRLLAARQKGAILALLGMRPENPGKYGRLVTAPDGSVQRIVEYADATPQEREIPLCNAGMMCADGQRFRQWLRALQASNAQGEYYLTDVVALAAREGRVVCVEAPESELAGINSRSELAHAEHILQTRLRQQAMDRGVTLVAPETVWFSNDTYLEPDVTVEPNVFFGPGVVVRRGAVIRAFSHLEGATVGEECVIGPYARLRPGAVCKAESHVGNFVELKNTQLGERSKANHLTYLGDAVIGDDVNIGAGTITCNYDGVFKHRTVIGKSTFIGSNSILVAPIKIGDNALVAAGSVLTEDVPERAQAFGRARQVNKPERGHAYKQELKARKEQG
ncbi:bifunctional UDP-N-acetylglucosamine diphosphorylase/glucosamine-1-phosphate N-acetyltransferase GlmU [Oecophyllibacter saccharovorans]|uniref:bifunctional UDP-N-acetylglucosamine diphosphorylase/glucosamine-1-phosphate N-acetyltransferase GlmU n=1 Tax=Oecophyllibacter saccharovorans TaxID=2558360 RepID=UPI001143FAC0|nr:bifunctional UDP-N-acetylglucosamine diphosphorylase/glucosamine-1-phosphate N-acetyltransferase GlmU [Oecophyllibacter saccharovorans]QDH14518.1 bifunctional UDP-N-acetylglucosamine diphosphorylase/glucosamine-1-phosphate N-acetyltransferase GlmU [Oecophyllibacter saccharovorans]